MRSHGVLVLAKRLGIVNQLGIFTNKANSGFPQEEYEEDIACERYNCVCVKAENNSMHSPRRVRKQYTNTEATVVIPTGKLPLYCDDS